MGFHNESTSINSTTAVGRCQQGFFEIGTQLREDWTNTGGLPSEVFRLWALDSEAASFKIHGRPLHREDFRRHPQTAIAGQSDNQPPFGIRGGGQNGLNHFRGDRKVAGFVVGYVGAQV